MDGERKKRKMEREEEEDEVEREGDEEKMEKFYGLIRNIREVREHLMRNAEDKSKGGEKREKENVEVWNPKFQPEDFMDGPDRPAVPPPTMPLAAPSHTKSQTEDKAEAAGEGDHLDLKLSL